jgi:hypothetical protein
MKPYLKLVFRLHALARMAQRGFHPDEIRVSIHTAIPVEQYPQDQPYPSCLLLLWMGQRPVHIVAANNDDDGETIIITVYEPDSLKWDDGYTRRR